jgi:hypothetical protein
VRSTGARARCAAARGAMSNLEQSEFSPAKRGGGSCAVRGGAGQAWEGAEAGSKRRRLTVGVLGGRGLVVQLLVAVVRGGVVGGLGRGDHRVEGAGDGPGCAGGGGQAGGWGE